MKKFALLLVMVLMLAAPSWAAQRSVAQVYTPTLDSFLALESFPVGFEESGRADWSQIVCSPATLLELKHSGFEVEVLIDDLDAWVKERRKDAEKMVAEPTPSDVDLDHYLTHQEMGIFLNDLAADYPDLMSVEVVGESVLGRDLYLVKISDNVATNEAETGIFYEGTIHGDELAGYIWALKAIEWLVTNYGADATITEMVDNNEFFFMPLSNPDGNAGSYPSRYNDNGVDLNRNFGFMWNSNPYYNPGSAPYSEPESQALASVWQRSQPLTIGISGHGGAVLFLYPWGYKGADANNDVEFDYLGSEYIYPRCLDPEMDTQGSVWDVLYQAPGVTGDELYGMHGAMGITFELNMTKQCPFSKSVQIWEDHIPAFTWLVEELGYGLHGMVTDASTSDPIAANIVIEGKWYTFSDSEVGDFHKYLRAGTYNYRVFADGYEDATGQVTIANDAATQLDIEMTAAAESANFAFRWVSSIMDNAEESTYPPYNVLGPVDGDFVGLGDGGYVVLDMGEEGYSGEIMVYESGDDGDEAFTLYGSADSVFGPWVQIGSSSGTTAFDLPISLPNARYVMVADSGKKATNDGFDLDAVGTAVYLAAFSASPTSGYRPMEVDFTDHSSGSPTSWSWEFGDGATSTLQNPSHTYTELGSYTVTLTIDGPLGEKSLTKTNYITVAEQPPVADFTGTPRTGGAPLNVQFTAQTEGIIDSYLWRFGDGQTSTEVNPLHTYQNEGKFSVTLEVSGPGGEDDNFKFWYIRVNGIADDDTADDDVVDDDVVDDDIIDDDIVDDDTDDDDATPDDDDTPDDDTADDDAIDDDAADDDAADNDDDDDNDDGCGC